MYQSEFLTYLESEKRFSPHTLLGYSNDLFQFVEFCASVYEVHQSDEVSHQMVRSWVVDLMGKELSAKSIHRKLSTLRTYFKFLKRQGVVDASPMQRVDAPKLPKRLPMFIDERKMKELFEGNFFEDNFSGLRDLLIMTIFYETGIRLSELIALKDGSVDHPQLTIKVIGKRNKERMIPISARLSDLMVKYKMERAEYFDSEQDSFLLLTDKGKKLYPAFARKKVISYLGLVTTHEKKSPHVLRHTFATHMLNNGASLNAIKELLGHASLAATQVYTHNSIEKLKSIHQITHPKG